MLRKQELKLETDEINDHATKREIEKIFRSIDIDGSAFKRDQINVKPRT